MITSKRDLTRRKFLRIAATSTAVGTFGQLPRSLAVDLNKSQKRKTILSFFCDDTTPLMGAKAFETFLDYCAEHGIAGESSAVLGWGHGQSMARNPTDEQRKFFEQVARAWKCGIDTHTELMTHYGLFDFKANSSKGAAMCEGIWLYEPAVTVQQYEQYFGNIIAEGERVGIKFTGLTKPGCSCKACKPRYAKLRAEGHTAPNPALWKALLNLAKQGKFRGPTVPCFVASSETDYGIFCKAKDEENGVYELVPQGGDRFGVWGNKTAPTDADYYITADGKSGIIARSVEAGDPCCLWYCHWWTVNPKNGVGWGEFKKVIERVRTHLEGRVIWMRPSDITNHYHKAGGWGFLDNL